MKTINTLIIRKLAVPVAAALGILSGGLSVAAHADEATDRDAISHCASVASIPRFSRQRTDIVYATSCPADRSPAASNVSLAPRLLPAEGDSDC